MIDTKLIGNKIRSLRLERGLTQSEFATNLSVSYQAVSNWERGIAPPDLDNLIQIARFFGVMVDDIIREKSDDFYIGIDGGGTKTEFVAVSSDGHVHKRVLKGASNPNDIGYAATSALVLDTVTELLAEFSSVKCVFCGIAGMSTGDYAKKLNEDLNKRFPKLKSIVKNDCFNLFAMAENVDMAVISGTGSVVFVKNGESFNRIGGWGHLLGGGGSAYDIGRAALKIALYEEDRKKEPSIMTKLIYKRVGVKAIWEHVKDIYSGGKPYIASFAEQVFDAYKLGDETAISIIDDNAKAIAEMLSAGVTLHGAKKLAIACGGIFDHYGQVITSHIAKYTNVELMISTLPPVYGACRAACLSQYEELPDDFDVNFTTSYGGLI